MGYVRDKASLGIFYFILIKENQRIWILELFTNSSNLTNEKKKGIIYHIIGNTSEGLIKNENIHDQTLIE